MPCVLKVLVLFFGLNAVNCALLNDQIETKEVTFKSPGLMTPTYLGPTAEKIVMFQENTPYVFISNDYGSTFANQTDCFKKDDKYLSLDEFYTTPDGKNIIFTNQENQILFISDDFGTTFTMKSLDFEPTAVLFYKTGSFLVFDQPKNVLYYTNTSGVDFTIIKQNVESWQNDKNKNLIIGTLTNLFFLRGADLDAFHSLKMKQLPIDGHKRFFVADEYLVVQSKDDKIFISKNGNAFAETEFYPRFIFKGFHLAEVADGVIKLALVHHHEARLYIGVYWDNIKSLPFVLSLKNIVAHVPDVTGQAKGFKNKPAFTELYKVDGHFGVYIANVYVMPLYSQLNFTKPYSIETRISVDHGATWKTFIEHDDYRMDCSNGCHLKTLTRMINGREYHQLGQNGDYNSPGLLITSFAERTFITLPYNFGRFLNGHHRLNVGDQGGLLVAIQIEIPTQVISYSLDNGENWRSQNFLDRNIFTTHILTDATHKSTVFQIFGIDMKSDEQVVVTIDFKNVFSRQCTDHDYIPRTISNAKICVGGKSQSYNLKSDPTCLNTKQIVYKDEHCTCQNTDFQCDAEYLKIKMTADCQPIFDSNPKWIPGDCKKDGGFFERTRGYIKMENTQCIADDTKKYLKQHIACPSDHWDTFLLIAYENQIIRRNLLNDDSEKLPIKINGRIYSVDYDLGNNCLFYSDTGRIVRVCLDGHSELEEIVIKGNTAFLSLAYDGASEILYYLEENVSNIYAVYTRGRRFGQIQKISSPTKQIPRYILVNPNSKTIIVDYVSETKIGQINVIDKIISIINIKTLLNIRSIAFGLDFILEDFYYFDFFSNIITKCPKSVINNCTLLAQHTTPSYIGPYKYIGVDDAIMYWTFSGSGYISAISKANGQFLNKVLDLDTNVKEIKLISINGRDSYATNREPAIIPPLKNEVECSTEEYKCRSNECISLTKICNGQFDCEIGDDEEDCPKI